MSPKVSPDLARVEVAPLARNHPGNESPSVAFASGIDGCVGNRWRFAQDRFDFPKLDPVSSDLHLLVQTSKALQPPVWSEPDAVARSIEAPRVERKSDKAIPRQVGSTVVARRDTFATDEEFAGHTDWHRLPVRVEDEKACVENGAADRYRARRGAPRLRSTRSSSR